MTEFTPASALAGGALIGASVVLLMFFHGRIAGISGILGGLLRPLPGDVGWRLAFLAGLIAAPPLVALLRGGWPAVEIAATPGLLIVAGLLVGFGTRLGSGCTSGHGVCGLARLSPRSLAATLTFMASAVVTVYLTRHLLAG